MIPSEPQRSEESAQTSDRDAGPVALGRPDYRWYHKMSAALLVAFCLGIGLFLLLLILDGKVGDRKDDEE